MKYKTILVTGGCGFIGSSLLGLLSSRNKYKLYSLDNYSVGTSKNHVSGVTYIGSDTQNIEEYNWVNPDLVFHLGEYSRVSTSLEDEQTVFQSNVIGTKKVIDYCINTKARLIYSASSTKFGDNGNNINASPYAFYKSMNVDSIINHSKWLGLDYSIAYFYNVYGKGQISEGKYSTVIGIFERLKRESKPLTVCSPGTQTRDFTHIDDIVSGLEIIMNKGSKEEYWLGTGNNYSIIEVANMFSDNIQMIPPRLGDRNNTEINLSSVLKLGWKAKVDLGDYIRSLD